MSPQISLDLDWLAIWWLLSRTNVIVIRYQRLFHYEICVIQGPEIGYCEIEDDEIMAREIADRSVTNSLITEQS
jgi:hypothetical protein